MSVTPLLSRAGAANDRLQAHLGINDSLKIRQLIGWAGENLAGAFAAEALASHASTAPQLQSVMGYLNVDSMEAFELFLLRTSASSVAASLDLCASALWRLHVRNYGSAREQGIKYWIDDSQATPVRPNHTTGALERWLTALASARERRAVFEARHLTLHRSTGRTLRMTAGGGTTPTAWAEYAVPSVGTLRIDAAVEGFLSFGVLTFNGFTDAVHADYP